MAPSVNEPEPLQLLDRVRPSYRERQEALRARQRQRIAARARGATADRLTTAGALAPDPLLRLRPGVSRAALTVVLILVGSAVVHAAGLALFAAVNATVQRQAHAGNPNEPVEVVVLERPPPPPPEPLPKEETRKALAPTPEPPPAKPKAKHAEPPPDPIREAEPLPPAAAVPRRIVGLSLESTTVGGGGPAFAVGNTRMGETDRVAREPDEASQSVTHENRPSARVPTANVTFLPPEKMLEVKPEYPPELRAQGIEADVVLAVVVDKDGCVVEVELIKGPRERQFVEAAIAAAEKEHYAPATRDGVPVAQSITFTVRFRLTET
jgi:protein TonB